MPPANTIAAVRAKMLDGSVIEYRDSEVRHIRERRWDAINAGTCVYLSVLTTDGYVFGVNLVDGSFDVAGEHFTPSRLPGTPLRPVYYKRMVLDAGPEGGTAALCDRFVIGWQTTEEWEGRPRNTKVGLVVNPATRELEVSEEI